MSSTPPLPIPCGDGADVFRYDRMEDEEACFWCVGPPAVMFETGAMEVDGEAPDVGIPRSYFFGVRS